ncbi:hypothetical protein MJO29_009036 [Puccinia striiformis f. sp. tritici]|nr:hypothetical protein MJO29_009036 [Puccinia striiformis f. sp. tritici]
MDGVPAPFYKKLSTTISPGSHPWRSDVETLTTILRPSLLALRPGYLLDAYILLIKFLSFSSATLLLDKSLSFSSATHLMSSFN